MTQPECPACGKAIFGTAVTFEYQQYHPGCFVCESCKRPIAAASYFVYQHQPYHWGCFGKKNELRCAGCGELILDQYAVGLGRVWHSYHYICSHCRRSLEETDPAEAEGRLYCPACYRLLFVPRCTICGEPVAEDCVETAWGEMYCRVHERHFPRCFCCGRPITASLTREGIVYGDRRVVCNLCRETSVDEERPAWSAFNKVKRYLARRGLDLIQTPIPLMLADHKQVAAVASTQSAGDVFGSTLKVPLSQENGHWVGGVRQIYILYGLPWELFTAVSAHQLGHAWLCLNNIRIDAPEVEEGFCELLGYLWLQSLGTPSSQGWMKGMQANPNPVFAEGLQRALASYRSHPLAQILWHLSATSRLP